MGISGVDHLKVICLTLTNGLGIRKTSHAYKPTLEETLTALDLMMMTPEFYHSNSYITTTVIYLLIHF